VRKTLGNGLSTGYGMEYVWPYLAGWGQNDKRAVGVVDTVCMQHAHDIQRKLIATNSKSSISTTNTLPIIPTKPQLEWDLTMSRYNFTAQLMEEAGMEWKEPTIFGEVDAATTVVPKVNWKKKLDRAVPDLGNVGSEDHSGVAVFLVLLVTIGGLLVTGAATTHARRPKKSRY
jgi:hypothetical protein